MRDSRDAKAMARTLREALKAKSIDVSHSECLELIAKTFGYENWNVLADKVDAAQLSTAKADCEKAAAALHCSFCAKSQFQIRKLTSLAQRFSFAMSVSRCATTFWRMKANSISSAWTTTAPGRRMCMNRRRRRSRGT